MDLGDHCLGLPNRPGVAFAERCQADLSILFLPPQNGASASGVPLKAPPKTKEDAPQIGVAFGFPSPLQKAQQKES